MPENRKPGRRAITRRKRHTRQRRRILVGGVALGLLLAVAAVALLSRDREDADDVAGGAAAWETTTFTDGPRLAVDQQEVDHGEVAYNHPVEATFRLKNVGDQPLDLGKPEVEILDGC